TAEEINKLVSNEINRYIEENKIKLIGHPLPNHEHSTGINHDDSGNMTFAFDVAFFPEFELTLDDSIEVEYCTIKVEEEDINNEIVKLRSSFGEHTYPDESSEEDYLDGHFAELDGNGNPKKGGIHHNGFFRPSMILDSTERERFINRTKGETITFDLRRCFPNDGDIARILRLSAAKAAEASGTFSFKIEQITRLTPAEVGSDLFKKVFPGHEDIDENHFRQHIKERIQEQYATESDRLFLKDSIARIIEKHHFALPESFLKRWIFENSERKTTNEEVEANFPTLVNDLRWDLIRQKIFGAHPIVPGDADMKQIVGDNFKRRYKELSENEEVLSGVVDKFMQNEKEVEKLKEQVISSQLNQLFKNTIKVKAIDVSWQEYLEKVIPHYNKTHSHE
ncbi:MAG TPA: trigger factor, partial [Bacteroidales bacterium]|nr:trigger factor [Bacteroidales bacterium]